MEPHSGLNNIDFVVIGVILLFGLAGLMYGFVRYVLSPFSPVNWVLSCCAAFKFYPLAIPMAQHYIKQDKIAEWVAMASIYIVTLILLAVIGNLIGHFAIRGRALSSIDRSLGFVYGLLQGVIILSCFYLAAKMILWPDIDQPPAQVAQAGDTAKPDKDRNTPPEMLMRAKTRRMMAYGAGKLSEMIPNDLIDKALQKIEAHKDEAEKAAAQKTLDRLSTPMPPQPAQNTTAEHQPD